MGIGVEAARWIIANCADHGIAGRCLTLGKQDISFNANQFYNLLAERDLIKLDNGEVVLEPDQLFKYKEMMMNDVVLARAKKYR